MVIAAIMKKTNNEPVKETFHGSWIALEDAGGR